MRPSALNYRREKSHLTDIDPPIRWRMPCFGFGGKNQSFDIRNYVYLEPVTNQNVIKFGRFSLQLHQCGTRSDHIFRSINFIYNFTRNSISPQLHQLLTTYTNFIHTFAPETMDDALLSSICVIMAKPGTLHIIIQSSQRWWNDMHQRSNANNSHRWFSVLTFVLWNVQQLCVCYLPVMGWQCRYQLHKWITFVKQSNKIDRRKW